MADDEFTINRERFEIRMTHIFNAPIERLYKAYTDPTQIPLWWGPRNLTTTIDKMDLRVGGEWRFVQKDGAGNGSAFRGMYLEVLPNERVAYTMEFESVPDHIFEEKVLFESQPDGKTRVSSIINFANVQDLDGMVASGMEAGARESLGRLSELVEKA